MISFPALLLSTLSIQAVLGQDYAGCTDFATDGAAASTFQYHRFYDFRNISANAPVVKRAVTRRQKGVTDGSWRNDWLIRPHIRESEYGVPVNFTAGNVYINQTTDPVQKYTSLLTLTTSREVGSTAQLAGEITYTEFNINAASVRVKARVSGTPGGVAGIFTYRNDTQESDIEMLTRNPSNRINYSNQPVYYAPPRYGQIPGATVEVDLPGGGVYTDWHVHRLDWIPGLSIFYVDGTKTRESRVNVPVDEARVYLNMWGAASEFTGVMPEGGEARLEVEWIEVVFNGTREGGGGVEGRRMRKRAYAARKCSVVERR